GAAKYVGSHPLHPCPPCREAVQELRPVCDLPAAAEAPLIRHPPFLSHEHIEIETTLAVEVSPVKIVLVNARPTPRLPKSNPNPPPCLRVRPVHGVRSRRRPSLWLRLSTRRRRV